MMLSEKIAMWVGKLPPVLKQLLDRELAAGGEVIDLEVGPGKIGEQVALVLKHPFHIQPTDAPADVEYQEMKDRDPQIFQFQTKDERFALITAKFKPMVLTPLGDGPPNPTEAHIARMAEIAKRDEARAAERKAHANDPPPPPHDPNLGSAGNKFLASMPMTFDMWHDGTGYDLDALSQATPAERETIETVLINHHPRDWRDIEALAQIDSPRAKAAVEAALKHGDGAVRREAMKYAGEKVDEGDREKLLVKALNEANLMAGLGGAIDEAAEFHPPAVVDALLRGALNRDGEAAVNFAATLFYIHGKAPEPFDWSQRPFFLRFNTSDREERKAVFREMCQIIGVDVEKYLRA